MLVLGETELESKHSKIDLTKINNKKGSSLGSVLHREKVPGTDAQ